MPTPNLNERKIMPMLERKDVWRKLKCLSIVTGAAPEELLWRYVDVEQLDEDFIAKLLEVERWGLGEPPEG